jgi:hypothetical protein
MLTRLNCKKRSRGGCDALGLVLREEVEVLSTCLVAPRFDTLRGEGGKFVHCVIKRKSVVTADKFMRENTPILLGALGAEM